MFLLRQAVDLYRCTRLSTCVTGIGSAPCDPNKDKRMEVCSVFDDELFLLTSEMIKIQMFLFFILKIKIFAVCLF